MKHYPWPASRIDKKTMKKLWFAKRYTGKPITELIQEACSAFYAKYEDVIHSGINSKNN